MESVLERWRKIRDGSHHPAGFPLNLDPVNNLNSFGGTDRAAPCPPPPLQDPEASGLSLFREDSQSARDEWVGKRATLQN